MSLQPTPGREDLRAGAAQLVDIGRHHWLAQRFDDAELALRQVLELDPDSALAHSNLGWVREVQGDLLGAEPLYCRAIDLDPDLTVARRNLAVLLVRQDRVDEAMPLLRAELNGDQNGLGWMQGLVDRALMEEDLSTAGRYASAVGRLRWGTGLNPPGRVDPSPSYPPSIPKLRHDAAQFRLLQQRGVLGEEIGPVVTAYEELADRMAPEGPETRVPLDRPESQAIGHAYNRLIHVADSPRLPKALSDRWDPADVESRYLDTPPGVVYVDNFLTPQALASLQRFCLESTIWSGNRYALGRLGSFFQDGFNSPLLLQIAEELRKALPQVIGDRYPLRQLWGFKCGPELPADATTHADFAAVNVNFWITPDDANLDPETGGLVVHDVDAPLNWDFDTYNGRTDVIEPYLRRQHSHTMNIPYRCNRAVIFNSDLFHASAGVSFRPGYENLRVNITMLYGERENEVHHPQMHRPDLAGAAESPVPAWRSAAFRRTRGIYGR